MILGNLFKKKINRFIYIFLVCMISYLLINIYKLKSYKNNERSDPGFRSAKSISNNNNLCIVSNKNIDCQKKILSELKKNKKSILFLGNSQMGAINNFKSGDSSYISLLSKNLKSKKSTISIKGLWLPNANIKEFEIINQTLEKCDINTKLIMIPVFLDDTRINDIRHELDNYPYLICQKEKSINSVNSVNSVNSPNLSNIEKLDDSIKKRFKIFKELDALNEKFRVDIYKLRNYFFNIKPTTIRNIRKTSYEDNINSLNNILKVRGNKKLKTLVYIPPLLNSNNGGPIPYKKIDYLNFKKQISKICKPQNCIYLNLENEVPTNLWGLKMSTNFRTQKEELDFMHFTGQGHKIFADKFSEIIKKYAKAIL